MNDALENPRDGRRRCWWWYCVLEERAKELVHVYGGWWIETIAFKILIMVECSLGTGDIVKTLVELTSSNENSSCSRCPGQPPSSWPRQRDLLQPLFEASGHVDEMIEFFHIGDVYVNLLHLISYGHLHSQRLPGRSYWTGMQDITSICVHWIRYLSSHQAFRVRRPIRPKLFSKTAIKAGPYRRSFRILFHGSSVGSFTQHSETVEWQLHLTKWNGKYELVVYYGH